MYRVSICIGYPLSNIDLYSRSTTSSSESTIRRLMGLSSNIEITNMWFAKGRGMPITTENGITAPTTSKYTLVDHTWRTSGAQFTTRQTAPGPIVRTKSDAHTPETPDVAFCIAQMTFVLSPSE